MCIARMAGSNDKIKEILEISRRISTIFLACTLWRLSRDLSRLGNPANV